MALNYVLTRRPQGQFVAVRGVLGSGRTRLLDELVGAAQAAGRLVVRAGPGPIGIGISGGVLRDITRQLVAPRTPELRLAGGAVRDGQPSNGERRAALLVDATARLIGAIASTSNGLLTAVDDLGDIDSLSRKTLLAVAEPRSAAQHYDRGLGGDLAREGARLRAHRRPSATLGQGAPATSRGFPHRCRSRTSGRAPVRPHRGRVHDRQQTARIRCSIPRPYVVTSQRASRSGTRRLQGYVPSRRLRAWRAHRSGWHGTVFRAQWSALRRTVAIKIAHPHLASGQRARARPFVEALAASRVRHCGSVAVFDYRQQDREEASRFSSWVT